MFNPILCLDDKVEKLFSKVVRKARLKKGAEKYHIGLGANVASMFLCLSGSDIFGRFWPFEFFTRTLASYSDYGYNLFGFLGIIKDEESKTSTFGNIVKKIWQSRNEAYRLPLLIGGLGLVGKFGCDVFEYLTKGKPITPMDYDFLKYGGGLLLQASSMYLKTGNSEE